MIAPFVAPEVIVAGTSVVRPASTAAGDLSLVPTLAMEEWSAAEAQLRTLGRRSSAPSAVVRRAAIVLGVVFDGRPVSEVARRTGTSRKTVRRWVRRFREEPDEDAMIDHARTGRPSRLTCRDEAVVITLACQRPQDVGRCEGRMTQQIIAEQAALEGCRMSRSSVQRILASAEVRPHHERYYLFTRKDHPEYEPRRDAICDVYTRVLPADEVIVCFDEKTGAQVLGLPARTPHGGRRGAWYGQPALIEQHYKRHGSRTIVIAARPDTGQLIAAEVFASGTYKTDQTIAFLLAIRRALPDARVIHLIMDNGPTHRSAGMQAFLASEEGRVFDVLYTPTHASWLNLAENVLSRFSRRYLHGKRWDGLAAFDQDMAVCFAAYQKVAKPIRWRYNPKESAESRTRPRRTRRGQARRVVRKPAPARPSGR